MIKLIAADLPPLSAAAVMSMVAAPSLESIAAVIVAAQAADAETAIGSAGRAVAAKVLTSQSAGAAQALRDALPEDQAEQVKEAIDALQWLTDGRGSFAGFTPTEANIGTAEDWSGLFTRATLKAARRVAADPNVAPSARYEAAMMARPQLRVVE